MQWWLLSVFLLISYSCVVESGCKNPEKEAIERQNKQCSWYNEKSCCEQSEVSYFTNGNLDQDCKGPPRSCMERLVQLVCGIECSGEYTEWLDQNSTIPRVRLCKSFADDIWTECRESQVRSRYSVGAVEFGACEKMQDKYSDVVELVEQGYGMIYYEGEENCFSGGNLISLVSSFFIVVMSCLLFFFFF